MSDTVEAGCDTVVLRSAATVVETCVAVLAVFLFYADDTAMVYADDTAMEYAA